MNEITEHIPAFADDGEPRQRAEFTTIAELEAIPFVAKRKADPAFIRFSKSERHLMVERGPTADYPEGSFWVVGFLRDPDAVDLPKWAETEAQRLKREAWNRGERIWT